MFEHLDGTCPSKPPVGKRGTGSWAPSSIREMLYNERYARVIEWGEYRNGYSKGTKVRDKQPTDSRLRVERPDLRIVDAKLWQQVQERLHAVRRTYIRDTNGKTWGRPGAGVESRYLLSGLSECGCCGHNIAMLGGKSGIPGKRKPLYYYGCSWHVTRGPTVCANSLKARMHEADAAVLDRVRSTVLTPAAIDYTVGRALELLAERQREDADAPKRLADQIKREQRQLNNLLRGLEESGGEKPDIAVNRIAELQRSIAANEQELATLGTALPTELELARIKRGFRNRLDQFNELLDSDVPLARQALRKLLDGHIRFEPEQRGKQYAYHSRWSMRIKPLMDEAYIAVASPRGFEPRLPP